MFQPNALALCQDCGKQETRATIVATMRGHGKNFRFTLQCEDCANKEAAARARDVPTGDEVDFF